MFATILPPAATPAAGATDEFALRQIAGPREIVVRLHDAEPPGGEAYVVEVDELLGPAGGKAGVASVVTFSGPMSPAVKDAADRADRDRIMPVMTAHATSTVRMLRLWQPERRRQVIVVLAVDQPTLEDGVRRIRATELLPGEDAALLPGPDHVEMFEVTT